MRQANNDIWYKSEKGYQQDKRMLRVVEMSVLKTMAEKTRSTLGHMW